VAVEDARVSAVQLKTNILLCENALVMLMGAPIPEDARIASRLSEIERLADVPAGLPADLLERRPDILAAEHALKSANANIGAARANFFPRISLTGSLGLMSKELDTLFTAASQTWTFAPQLMLPLFDTGRNLAALDTSWASRDMAAAAYEKAVQGAFREVSDALAQRSTIRERLDSAQALLEATSQSYDISSKRYEIGIDSFLNVLDAQRAFFGAQQNQVNALLQREINTLNLYKALGGGWE
jgi:multidrug efflux system outer membrane protein